MKRSTITLLTCLFITACIDRDVQNNSEPPALYPPPMTVAVNTNGGYTHNTVSGDSILPLINFKGDTILTGVPIPITGKVLPPDSLGEPVTHKADKPHIQHNELNVRIIPKDISVIEVNRDSLIRLSTDDDIECEACVSEVGDTIPTGVALPVIGRVVPCIQPQPVKAGAPEYKHSASLNIQLLGIDQGLEGSYVRTITEDKSGNIWIGSYYGGVSRYDGTTFTTYGEEEGLSNRVYVALEDRNGNMWFATDNKGVCMYDGNTFTYYSEREGLSHNYVYSMIEDSRGNIWIGSNEGVSKLSFGDGSDKSEPHSGSGTLTNYTVKEGFIDKTVRGIVEDHEGNMWFGSWGGGVCKIDAEAVLGVQNPVVFTHYQEKDGLADRYVTTMDIDKDGNIWFATVNGLTKLAREIIDGVEKEFFTTYTEKDGLGGDVVYDIGQEENGELWFGSYGGGVSKLSTTILDGVEKECFTVYTEDDGFSTNEGGPHLIDKSGNIWFNAWGEGICILRKRPFRNYTLKDGLPFDRVYTLVEDRAGDIWYGTDGGGAMKMILGGNNRAEVSSMVSYPTEAAINRGSYYNAIKDRHDNIWYGGYRVYKISPSYVNEQYGANRDEYVTGYNKQQGFLRSKVSAMMEDHLGNIWIASGSWLSKHDFSDPAKGSVLIYSEEEGINTHINRLLEDTDGNIWIGENMGLSRLSPEKEGSPSKLLTRYTEKEGLCNNTVEALLEDRNGNIWIGTVDGLDVLHKSQREDPIGEQLYITHYTTKEGLSHNSIYSIVEDNKGHIWVGTKSGLNEFVFETDTGGNIDRPFIAKEIRHYGKFDGLKGVDFIDNSVLLDSKNRLWWGCTKSLNMLDLDRFTTAQEPPRIHMNSIAINEQFIDHHNLVLTDSTGFSHSGAVPFYNYPKELVLDHDKDHLTFHFAAIDWVAPHKIKYSYRLEGMNDGWSRISPESKAEYRNIPHGTYTFKVRAIGESGEWSKPFEYQFTVNPPWWHTWWARVFYLIIASLVIWLFVRRRTAELKRRQIELVNEVRAATFEINEQKDEVLKQKEVAEEEREKAVKSEAFKQQFLANMSHEIRTPMNAVMGMTSLLLDKQPREDQFKYLDGIRTSGDNLLHIINDILDLSKIESGKMELEHIDFSFKESIDHVKKILDHKAAEKGLELLTNISTGVPDIVIGDPIRLNQVLINLTGNAIKFTEKGSVLIEVSNAGKGIKFSIIDTGIGIPEDKLQTVFENFAQANASDTRKHGGTGLGLSISRQLVNIMGGRIIVESKEGFGTTFSFTVQLDQGSSEKLEERLALDKDVDGSILDGLRILITDDNEYNRIVAKDTLQSKANVEIHEAADGQAAIDMVGKMRFDVILMDIQMPGMNGYEATRVIRSKFEGPIKDTPIIALTASVLRTDLDKCKQAGMDSYIPKPFKAQQLITGIAQVLGIKLKISKSLPKEVKADGSSDPVLGSITDMTYLYDFCEGDTEKMKKYIRMFTSTAPALIERIRTALDKNDLADIAGQVHAFKTKWIMMGMTNSKDLALELEKQCREGEDLQGIKHNSKLLIEHITRSLVELNKELKTDKYH